MQVGRSLVAVAVLWMAAAGLGRGSTAHACCTEIVDGTYFHVARPRNTLVRVWRRDHPPSLRRVAPVGTRGGTRRAESIPMTPLGVGDLWRPARLLEVGAEYEVEVGPDVWSRFTVERDVDLSPPAFGGAKAVTLLRHDRVTSADDPPGREILIAHDPLPPDVAFIVVSLRRQGPGEARSRQMLGLRHEVMGERRDRTLLSSSCGTDHPPPIAVGATYCVSVAAHDAAGNASGGDVEVCSPVIDCRDPSWRQALQCPLPYGTPVYPDVPDEVTVKDVALPGWASPHARSVASVIALLLLAVAWRLQRRRRRRGTIRGNLVVT